MYGPLVENIYRPTYRKRGQGGHKELCDCAIWGYRCRPYIYCKLINNMRAGTSSRVDPTGSNCYGLSCFELRIDKAATEMEGASCFPN